MEGVEHVMAGLQEVSALLDEEALRPDPSRRDWASHALRVSQLRDRLQSEVLDPFAAARESLEPTEARDGFALQAALAVAETACVLFAAGSSTQGQALLTAASGLAPAGAIQEELVAATREPATFVLLTLGRWHLRQQQSQQANKLFDRVALQTAQPRLKEAAKEARNAPQPIEKAPPLFTLNGFGTGLYGSREARDDGSYVTTLCLCVLFVPIFPLAAYRVIVQGDNRYLFLAKERMSSLARGYRKLLLGAAVAAIGALAIDGYLSSPARRATLALDEAREVAARGESEAAIGHYEALLETYGWRDIDHAHTGAMELLDLYAANLNDPLTLDHVEDAARIIGKVKAWPTRLQGAGAGEALMAMAAGWAEDLGSGSPASLRAAIRLLDLALGIGGGGKAARLEEPRQRLITTLAASLATTWPLLSINLWLELGDRAEALREARAVLGRLGNRPSLWVAAASAVDRFTEAAPQGELADAAKSFQARLDGARKKLAAPARQRALASQNRATLAAHLRRAPWDQEAAVALANLSHGRGQTEAAIAILVALGEPGWLFPGAQLRLASFYAATGKLQEAEAILDPALAARLPAFEKARRAHAERAETLQEDLSLDAQLGRLPDRLMGELEKAADEKRPEIFANWVSEELSRDAELTGLKERYDAFADVAPAALTLGMVKLRLASERRGAEPARLLSEAERVFLAVRAEGEGVPTYHLGLGQVYHRLGKAEKGERELERLLARKDPALELAVASAYRELGLVGRAQKVATTVFEHGLAPHAGHAAVVLAMLATDIDAKESWFGKADPSVPFVRISLQELRAQRLFWAGKLAQADALFAEVAAAHQKDAAHDPAAANNAALAYQQRYLCTGEMRMLAKALQGLEAAMRMAPDNALVTGNLAAVTAYQGRIEVLGKWLETRLFRPDGAQTVTLLETLGRGPLRGDVLAAARANASLARSMELTRQEAVLGPNRPSPHRRESEWLSLWQDVKGLEKLQARLARLSNLDTSQAEEQQAAYQRGELDERLNTEIDASLAQLETALGRAKQRGHARTTAAVQLLRGLKLAERARLGKSLEAAEQSVAALRAAHAAWPQLGAAPSLAWALVEVALLKAAAVSAALGQQWDTEARVYSAGLLLSRLVEHPQGEDMLEAVRGQRELIEAARVLRVQAGERPRLETWFLAQAAGDAELEKENASAFHRDDLRLALKIETFLSPWSAAAALKLARLERGH